MRRRASDVDATHPASLITFQSGHRTASAGSRLASSSVFSQNWYISYADVFAGSSHTVPASVLPNFEPSLLVTSGSVRPYAGRPWTRRISSTPAVMLPH